MICMRCAVLSLPICLPRTSDKLCVAMQITTAHVNLSVIKQRHNHATDCLPAKSTLKSPRHALGQSYLGVPRLLLGRSCLVFKEQACWLRTQYISKFNSRHGDGDGALTSRSSLLITISINICLSTSSSSHCTERS